MSGPILIVEDNPMNRKLLEQALSLTGHAILTSADGVGLVELVASQSVALVLMDIQLPAVSGIDLLKLLRADPRVAAVPVIAVTAFADKTSIGGFRQNGFNEVITKPISIRHLLGVVEQYCG
jgi:two-component system, cell cycle response regulator DivK